MKKQNDKAMKRENAEQSEKLPTTEVDAPDSRFQTKQQSGLVEDTTATSSTNKYSRKPSGKGTVLRQEVAAEALSSGNSGGSDVGVSSPMRSGLRPVSFSGDTGTLLGNVSGTPSMSRSYQGNSRIDKRMSDANKNINFNASEQILYEYDAIPPLAASESTVGQNGNPKNVAARSQKKTGYSSAEMLYDRSLDIIEKDGFVYSCGQVVKQAGVDYHDYPLYTEDADGEQIAYDQIRGNYAPRELVVTITNDNGVRYVSDFHITEDDLCCNNETDLITNQSATNQLIDMNRAELMRQTIDADAGSPTSEHFNPLGRSVREETATCALLQDFENSDGAEIFASYKFANKARGHYLNRTGKDGQDLTGPAIDALYGHLAGAHDMDELRACLGTLDEGFISKAGIQHGSAALMYAIFDSPRKYQTKADLVNQPRGLKMHIQTADNNMDPFRCKKEFVAALNSVDAYSTIDHAYDPTAPVYILDNVRLIHPYSWAKALSYTRSAPGPRTYTSTAFRYSYAAGAGLNTYTITVGEPLLNGVAWFIEQHANSIYNAARTTGNSVTITIPIVHSTTHFSLWDLLVCASTPYIIYERTNSLKDVLDYEQFYKYPIQGNVPIKDANPLNAVNYGTMSPYEAISVQQMAPSSAIRWKYPETWLRIGGGLMAPFYFNEAGYTFDTTTPGASTMHQNTHCEFTTPVVRGGIKLSGLDDFFGMEVKDQLLVTDRMTRLPGHVSVETPIAAHVYKYGQETDGIIVLDDAYLTNVTAADAYSTPRLLGYYCDAPATACQVYDGELDHGTWVAQLGALAALEDIGLGSMKPSFRAIQYKGVYSTNEGIPDRPLAAGSVNVNRAQTFTQIWGSKWAGFADKSRYFDLILSLNEALEYNDEVGTLPRFVTLNNKAQFSPYVYGPYAVNTNRETTNTAYSIAQANRPILFSMHAALWALLQKTCFIVNPFENSDADEPATDPFGVAYLFGLAGFISANYDEEIYNRSNQYQNQGFGYTMDPMTAASPIFKDAYSKTQIG